MPVRLDSIEYKTWLLFRGYDKRKNVVDSMKAPYEIILAYNYVNKVIDDELEVAYMGMPVFAPTFKEDMIKDIANRTGYDKSALRHYMSLNTYKKYKRRIKEAVAKRIPL